jgi:putative colanic acid biosynthesis acetyltransferase WcaF
MGDNLTVETLRPGDRNPGRDHATLVHRALWPLAAKAFRRSIPGRARPAVLRAFGAVVDDDVVIESDVRVPRPWLVRVEGPAWIGEGARIDHRGPVTVEREACLAPGSRVGVGGRDRSPITVGSGAWVGPEARVLPGATIGSTAVLAGHSVVRGTVESGRTVVWGRES